MGWRSFRARDGANRDVSDRRIYVAQLVALAAAYYGSAKLGLSLAFETPSVTAIWPPTGIALAALVLGGYRLWPGVALGAFLANAWTGVPLHTVLGITVGNTLEAIVGTWLLLGLAGFRPELERVRDVVALAVLAGAISTTISATIGVASLLAGNEIDANDLAPVWRTWWLGDMGGDLVVAPALMIAATHWPYRRAPGRLVEGVLVAAAVIATTVLVFQLSRSLSYLIFPLLTWAALRFWQPGAAVATVAVAAVAVPLTEQNLGPFAGNSPDERLLLAQTFVGVTGITALVLAAVTSARRRAEQVAEHIAKTLQESLLPAPLPDIPGVEIAVGFRPAGRASIVGGDFYDLFQVDERSWAVVIGDVSGKEVEAAALTGVARHTLRALAVHERRPARILELLNDALRRQTPDGFCTVAYASVELNSATGAVMTLSSGGHPLPLILRFDGTVEEVGVTGLLLGASANPLLAEARVVLRPGDTVLLYTDGLTDAHAPRQVVRTSDLAAILRSCAGRPASAILETVEKSVLDSSASLPRDDITLLVLRLLDGRVQGQIGAPERR